MAASRVVHHRAAISRRATASRRRVVAAPGGPFSADERLASVHIATSPAASSSFVDDGERLEVDDLIGARGSGSTNGGNTTASSRARCSRRAFVGWAVGSSSARPSVSSTRRARTGPADRGQGADARTPGAEVLFTCLGFTSAGTAWAISAQPRSTRRELMLTSRTPPRERGSALDDDSCSRRVPVRSWRHPSSGSCRWFRRR